MNHMELNVTIEQEYIRIITLITEQPKHVVENFLTNYNLISNSEIFKELQFVKKNANKDDSFQISKTLSIVTAIDSAISEWRNSSDTDNLKAILNSIDKHYNIL